MQVHTVACYNNSANKNILLGDTKIHQHPDSLHIVLQAARWICYIMIGTCAAVAGYMEILDGSGRDHEKGIIQEACRRLWTAARNNQIVEQPFLTIVWVLKNTVRCHVEKLGPPNIIGILVATTLFQMIASPYVLIKTHHLKSMMYYAIQVYAIAAVVCCHRQKFANINEGGMKTALSLSVLSAMLCMENEVRDTLTFMTAMPPIIQCLVCLCLTPAVIVLWFYFSTAACSVLGITLRVASDIILRFSTTIASVMLSISATFGGIAMGLLFHHTNIGYRQNNLLISNAIFDTLTVIIGLGILDWAAHQQANIVSPDASTTKYDDDIIVGTFFNDDGTLEACAYRAGDGSMIRGYFQNRHGVRTPWSECRIAMATGFNLGLAALLACCSIWFALHGTPSALSVAGVLRLLVGRSPSGQEWYLGPLFWVMHTTFLPLAILFTMVLFMIAARIFITMPILSVIDRITDASSPFKVTKGFFTMQAVGWTLGAALCSLALGH